MKYKSTKEQYLDLRNRLSKVTGYIDGVTHYSPCIDGIQMVCNGSQTLFDALEPVYKERASIQYAIKNIEEKNRGFMGWLI